MLTMVNTAVNKSTAVATVTFTDLEGGTVVPTTATWTLTDSYGNIVNSREDVGMSVDSPVYIVLTDADIDQEDSSDRIITVDAVYDSSLYGSNLPSRQQVAFTIGEWTEPEVTT